MYLGPSKYWWAYLGLKSNPALHAMLRTGVDQAIFFDDPARLPSTTLAACNQGTHFFYLLWDAIADPVALSRTTDLIGDRSPITLIVVGDPSDVLSTGFDVQKLYADGKLIFNVSPLPFDARTRAILIGSNVRTLLMPLKNVLQKGIRLRDGMNLLFGRSRLVFCGSYGIAPETLRQLCERHSVDRSHFDDYAFPAHDPAASIESYRATLSSNGSLLALLYRTAVIDAKFLSSAIHLLGREYFLRRIDSAGLPLFENGYAGGTNINVYTTPFYAQHVFPDFGSAVGTGNYPRQADLQYFKKRFILIELIGDLEQLMLAAEAGALDTHFEERWHEYEPAIRRSLQ